MGKNYKLIWSLFFILVLISCNKSSQKPNNSKKDNLPKVPKVLTQLEDKILKIMYDLDSIGGIEKAIQLEKTTQLEPKEEITVQINTKQSKKEQQQKEDENKNKTEQKADMQQLISEDEILIPLLKAMDVKGNFSTPPPNIDKVWAKISDDTTEVHKMWNVLEAQLQLAKIPKSKTENFEKTLDDLTLSITSKEVFNSLKLVNELTKITANFRSYFDGIANHRVYEMYYNVRNAILFAASANYKEAIKSLDEITKIGDSIRQDLIKKDSENILSKFELSVEDFKKQLEDKNFNLGQIKASIVIKNIKLIQNVFETEK